MKPDTFATQFLAPRDQFEAWREWCQPVLDVIPKHPAGDGFLAENHTWKLAGLAVSRTSGPPVHVVRTGSHLRRDPVDHWILSYCIRGAHFTRTARTSLEVPARVSFLWSLGEEFAYERTHADQIQFFMSRDTFDDIAPLLDAALGSVLDTPLGHLLGDYLLALGAPPANANKGRFPPTFECCCGDGDLRPGDGDPLGRWGDRCSNLPRPTEVLAYRSSAARLVGSNDRRPIPQAC
jgi:hypothetical protein